MPGRGSFQVLPEVPWAGKAGSASKNKEQLRTAVQPLVSEVKVGQSCSAPSPSSIQNSCTASTTVCRCFCRKGSGGEEKHNYHLTHSQPAHRELQKGDHNTQRPERILLVQEGRSGWEFLPSSSRLSLAWEQEPRSALQGSPSCGREGELGHLTNSFPL